MNCIHCKASFEPKVKFCSSKCRTKHFREDVKCNDTVTELETKSLQNKGNVPDWAKDILKPKEEPKKEVEEYSLIEEI